MVIKKKMYRISALIMIEVKDSYLIGWRPKKYFIGEIYWALITQQQCYGWLVNILLIF